MSVTRPAAAHALLHAGMALIPMHTKISKCNTPKHIVLSESFSEMCIRMADNGCYSHVPFTAAKLYLPACRIHGKPCKQAADNAICLNEATCNRISEI